LFKWIAALFALAISLPFAILVLLGGFFLQIMSSTPPSRRRQEENQHLFFQTLFQLAGHIAKADGRISESEVKQTEQLMTQMGLSADKRKEAIALFKAGSSSAFDIDLALNNFRLGPGRSRQMRQFLIVSLISVSLSDGNLDQTEQQLLVRIASAIGISPMQLQHLINMIAAQHSFYHNQHSYSGNYQQRGFNQQTSASELDMAYKALGVSSSDSDATIKKAYRSLMKEYHPDKLIAKGLPEDMIKVATEKAQEVQAAYDLIKRARKN